ncbi:MULTISPECIES: YesL family protein [Gracilibacillus]|uniref:YesL family protein n=1 Tax=Gracilibacillus TaxID=74385 RepID=UPI000826B69C|nr:MULTISPECIES: DUF624 domain-containing protein [Gracilibacillus]
MFFEKLTEIMRIFCIYFLRFIYLNMLWGLFTLAGLVVFGFSPATIAVYRVQEKLIEEKHIPSIWKTFWQAYRSNFWSANKLGFVLTIIGGIIYFDLQFFIMMDHAWSYYAGILFYILSVWYMIMLLYIIPVSTSYSLTLFGKLKQAFIIGMLHPIKTILMAISLAGTVYILLMFPQLLITIGISLISFIVMIFGKTAVEHVSELKHRVAQQQTVKQT